MTPSVPVGTVRRDRPADILSLIYAGCESASRAIRRRSHAKGHGEHLLDPRRGAKRREEHLFVRGGRGGRGELQHLFVHEGARRGAKNTFLSAEDAEGAENIFWIREGARRGAKNTFLSAEDAEGAENSEDLWEVSCVSARVGLILFRQIAVQAKVNAPRSPSRFPDCGRPGDLPYSRSTPTRGAFDGLFQFSL